MKTTLFTCQLLSLPIALIFSSASVAHQIKNVKNPIGENSWNFKAGEEQNFNFLNSAQGASYGCNHFQTPPFIHTSRFDTEPISFVSFDITYKGQNKPIIEIGEMGKISEPTQVYENGILTDFYKISLTNITKLNLHLPANSEYLIENTTGKEIFSNTCDAGILN